MNAFVYKNNNITTSVKQLTLWNQVLCEVEQHWILFVTNVIYYEASLYFCKYLRNETLVKKRSATALGSYYSPRVCSRVLM